MAGLLWVGSYDISKQTAWEIRTSIEKGVSRFYKCNSYCSWWNANVKFGDMKRVFNLIKIVGIHGRSRVTHDSVLRVIYSAKPRADIDLMEGCYSYENDYPFMMMHLRTRACKTDNCLHKSMLRLMNQNLPLPRSLYCSKGNITCWNPWWQSKNLKHGCWYQWPLLLTWFNFNPSMDK